MKEPEPSTLFAHLIPNAFTRQTCLLAHLYGQSDPTGPARPLCSASSTCRVQLETYTWNQCTRCTAEHCFPMVQPIHNSYTKRHLACHLPRVSDIPSNRSLKAPICFHNQAYLPPHVSCCLTFYTCHHNLTQIHSTLEKCMISYLTSNPSDPSHIQLSH